MLAELFRLLRRLWPLSLLSTLLGTASGLASAGLLALTNRALQTAAPGASLGWLWGFAGLCLLALFGEVASDIGNNLVGQRVIARLRLELSGKILAAPIAQLEALHGQRLITSLNQDIDSLSAFSFLFSSLAIASATLLGCLGYLLLLSPALFLVTLAALVLGVLGHALARRNGVRRFVEVREEDDRLQQHYRAITEGAKELRLNGPRRRFVHAQQLRGSIAAIQRLRVRAANLFVSANAFGSALYFVIIGLLLALQAGYWPAERAAVTGFVLVLLYMKGPIQEWVGALPTLGRAQIALQRLSALSARFVAETPHLLNAPGAQAPDGFERIELRAAGYRFASPAATAEEEEALPFALGPLDLSLRRGETLFIVGENGCGKTTLIKLLLGLYTPSEGSLSIDGREVDEAGRDGYRQLFSAVFSDYYLFDRLLSGEASLDEQAQRYLRSLQIDHKVSVRDGQFSTTALSTGQRKRLALVHAYLEQRPILVLDEWAADQDPTFRRVFYRQILPELKQMGRTLVVVSHDDRYFDAADRIVRMENGRIIADEPANA
ncbi:MAG: ABC transporter ATP-binding/permease protein YojI [Stenotrophomonas maltophilia]|nr:MAG: ABC transporter ATP-binding/permease protein YojI [Stenotrophomonas maltophilia]